MKDFNSTEKNLKLFTAKLDNWTPNKPLAPMIEPESKKNTHNIHQVRPSIDDAYIQNTTERENVSRKGENDDEALERLAKLRPIEYSRVRKEEANKLGVSVAALDAEIKAYQENIDSRQCSFFGVDEPWSEPVNGKDLLSSIECLVHQYIICSPAVASAAPLWILMTYLMDAINVAPLAIITAPEKACGKSKLLEFMGKLVCKPLPTSNISASALFRSIEAWHPTLLIDETDTFLGDNEELRGVINSGHTRSNAFVMRVEGENHEPKRHSTWAAKVLCGISNKNLHDTITSRSIIFELRRKLPSETVLRLRANDDAPFKVIREKLVRWALDNRASIEKANPDLPESLSDREQDNWEGLFAIADAAGGKWPEIARSTAVHLSSKQETKSLKTELLEDIQAIFEGQLIDRISSVDLVSALCADEEAPWKTYNRGREITPKQLAGLLKGYSIISKSVRIGLSTPKGYECSQFIESWERYTSVDSPDTKPTFGATPPPINAHIEKSVAATSFTISAKTPSATEKTIWNNDCGGVADKTHLNEDSLLDGHNFSREI